MTYLLIIYYDKAYISFLVLKNKCGGNFDVLERSFSYITDILIKIKVVKYARSVGDDGTRGEFECLGRGEGNRDR